MLSSTFTRTEKQGFPLLFPNNIRQYSFPLFGKDHMNDQCRTRPVKLATFITPSKHK
uniref:Uncharacterized protein n=1 Tax=Rhizophora mucronata TaxID=61149 RepID=A0A2P2QQN5_RHIMU